MKHNFADQKVSIPHPNPTISYWQDPPSPLADLRSTPDLPQSADYVIIGSGISAACIAMNLLEKRPAANIVMLEARQACSGATGRNGGHTKAATYRSFLSNVQQLGTDEALKIARLEYANIQATHTLARTLNIPCDSLPCNTVDIILDPAHLSSGHSAIAQLQAALDPDEGAARYTTYDADAARRKFLTPGALGAFEYPAGSISAYAFATGILSRCLAQRLNLQTDTPATSIRRLPSADSVTWEVSTPRGSITTETLVLATNGYTPYLLPSLQGVLVPVRGQITAQRAPSGLPPGTLPTTYSFIYSNGYDYMIPRPAGSLHSGDIVIGGGLARLPEEGASEFGNTDDATVNEVNSKYLKECTAGYFGVNWGKDHPEGRVRREWTGVMGFTPDERPFVGEVPGEEGLWVQAGFNGHGMVLCLMCARALVNMVLGDEASNREWFPESFRLTKERMSKQFEGLHMTVDNANDSEETR